MHRYLPSDRRYIVMANDASLPTFGSDARPRRCAVGVPRRVLEKRWFGARGRVLTKDGAATIAEDQRDRRRIDGAVGGQPDGHGLADGRLPIEHSIEHSIECSTECSTECSIERSIEHSISRSIERSIELPSHVPFTAWKVAWQQINSAEWPVRYYNMNMIDTASIV